METVDKIIENIIDPTRTIMVKGTEYRVSFINEKNKTFNLTAERGMFLLQEKQVFNFENEWYIVTYVNRGKGVATVKKKER